MMGGVARVLKPFAIAIAASLVAVYAASLLVSHYYEVPITEHALRFERPWAALLLPFTLLVVLSRGSWDHARSARVRFSHGGVLAQLPSTPKLRLRPLLYALRTASLVLCVLGLMGPQSIHARGATELDGIDIVVTLDLSLSMEASDITPNRFEATKQVVDDFLTRRPNDRVGAVIFGRDAYTLMPLTTDKDILRSAISELQLGMIDGRGTAIGNAVGVSLNRLRKSEAKSKVVILLTDGDSNSGNVAPDQAAAFAEQLNVKLYTILMGRSDDAPVQRGLDLFGRPLFGGGNFPVNPDLLRRMAERTGGQFFLVSDRSGLERSFHTILDALEKSQIEEGGVLYGELFPAVLGPALLLLLIEVWLGTTVLRRWP